MTLENDYGMIDGFINNGRRGEVLEKAQAEAHRITPEKNPISRNCWRMQNGSVGCGKPQRNPPRRRSPQSWATYEPEQEMAAGMGVLPGQERQMPV